MSMLDSRCGCMLGYASLPWPPKRAYIGMKVHNTKHTVGRGARVDTRPETALHGKLLAAHDKYSIWSPSKMHSRQAATQPGPMGLLQVEPPVGSAARLPMHAMTASYKPAYGYVIDAHVPARD